MIVAALLGGCGGDDGKDGDSRTSRQSTTDARPASEEFVRRVDALCEDAVPELAEINVALVRARDATRAGRVSAAKTFDTFASLLRRASAITDRFDARLRAIEPPRAERRFYDALVGSMKEASANLRQQVSAAEAQDAVRLRSLSVRGSVINAERKGLMAGHGDFASCGGG